MPSPASRFDYRVVQGSGLEQYSEGKWERVGEVAYNLAGNRLMMEIPFEALGLSSVGDLEFKWSDNMQEADPIYWYLNGDAAPGGRFTIWTRF